MDTEKRQKVDLYWLHIVIMLTFMLGFGYIPAMEPITPTGMKILGIFIGMLYGWTTINMTVPSVLGLIFAGFTGIADNCKIVFCTAFGNDTVILVIFALIFVGFLNQLKVVDYISNWLISRKSLNGKPWLFSFIILFGTLVMGMVAHPFPAIVFFWDVIYKVCEIYGYQKKEMWPTVMIFGVCVAAILSMGTCPYRAYVVGLLGTYTAVTGANITFFQYFVFALPLSIILLVVYLSLTKIVFKADVTKILNIDTKKIATTQKMTDKQKIGLMSLSVFLVAVFVPNLLPPELAITKFFNTLGTTTTCISIVVIMLCIRYKKDVLLDLQEAAATGIQWHIVLLIVCIMTFVGYITNEVTGISAWMNIYLGGMLASFKGFSLIIVMVALAAIITNFANNIVVGAIFITLGCALAPGAGIEKIDMLSVMMIYGAMLGFVTPAASPYAATAFANKEWLTSEMIYKLGIMMLGTFVIVFSILGFFWGNIVF